MEEGEGQGGCRQGPCKRLPRHPSAPPAYPSPCLLQCLVHTPFKPSSSLCVPFPMFSNVLCSTLFSPVHLASSLCLPCARSNPPLPLPYPFPMRATVPSLGVPCAHSALSSAPRSESSPFSRASPRRRYRSAQRRPAARASGAARRPRRPPSLPLTLLPSALSGRRPAEIAAQHGQSRAQRRRGTIGGFLRKPRIQRGRTRPSTRPPGRAPPPPPHARPLAATRPHRTRCRDPHAAQSIRVRSPPRNHEPIR